MNATNASDNPPYSEVPKLADPTFKAFFAKEKTAEAKQAERDAKNAPHKKAAAEREERNRDKRKKKYD